MSSTPAHGIRSPGCCPVVIGLSSPHRFREDSFIEILTDSCCFAQPLHITAARSLPRNGWMAREVVRVFPHEPRPSNFAWLQQFSFGPQVTAGICSFTHSPGRQASHRSSTTVYPDFLVFVLFTHIPAPRS